jgi:hypothetical protein
MTRKKQGKINIFSEIKQNANFGKLVFLTVRNVVTGGPV